VIKEYEHDTVGLSQRHSDNHARSDRQPYQINSHNNRWHA